MPVSYASRTLNVHERRYSTTEREGLAVVWAVDHFQSYVMGTPFVILTNHAALTSLGTKANLDGKLLRFAERLSSYQYEIVFRPGQQNWLANMLSRACWVEELSETEESREARRRNWVFLSEPSQKEAVRSLHYRFGGHYRFHKMIRAVAA